MKAVIDRFECDQAVLLLCASIIHLQCLISMIPFDCESELGCRRFV